MTKVNMVILSAITAILLFTATPWGHTTDQYQKVIKSEPLIMGVKEKQKLQKIMTALHKAADKDYAPLTKTIFRVSGKRI